MSKPKPSSPCLYCGKPAIVHHLCRNHHGSFGHLSEAELLVYLPKFVLQHEATVHQDFRIELRRAAARTTISFGDLPWWFFACEQFYVYLRHDFIPEEALDRGTYYTFLVDDIRPCLGIGDRCLVQRRGRYFEVRTRTRPACPIVDACAEECLLCHGPVTHDHRCAVHRGVSIEEWLLRYDVPTTIERETDLGWRIGRDRYRHLPAWVTELPSFYVRAPRHTPGIRAAPKIAHAIINPEQLWDLLLDLELGDPHVLYENGVLRYETPVVFLRELVDFQREALQRFIVAAEQELAHALV